jgi:hypothetical protein
MESLESQRAKRIVITSPGTIAHLSSRPTLCRRLPGVNRRRRRSVAIPLVPNLCGLSAWTTRSIGTEHIEDEKG